MPVIVESALRSLLSAGIWGGLWWFGIKLFGRSPYADQPEWLLVAVVAGAATFAIRPWTAREKDRAS